MIRKKPRLTDPVTGAVIDPKTGALLRYEYALRSAPALYAEAGTIIKRSRLLPIRSTGLDGDSNILDDDESMIGPRYVDEVVGGDDDA